MTRPGPHTNGKAPTAAERLSRRRQGKRADAPPRQEPPPPGRDEPEPWPDILPLGDEPETVPFPVEVLPLQLRALVDEVAESIPCAIDYAAVPLLVHAAAAVGASRAIEIKPGHVQSACLYAGVVALPGSGKSPAAGAIARPTRDAEDRQFVRWEAQMAEYERQAEEYEAAKAARKRSPEGPTPVPPARPVLARYTAGNATVEALAMVLRDNPRGVVVILDELTAWVGSMNAYREGGRGADQQFWLSTWSGESVLVDRKKTHEEGPLHVRDPFVCVTGSLPPDKLRTLRGDKGGRRADADGFLDRVLLAYPAEVPADGENWRHVSAESLEEFRRVITRLHSLEMEPAETDESGRVLRYRPVAIPLDEGAREEWVRLTRDVDRQRNADTTPDHLKGHLSKLRAYGARLALVVHYLRWACGEVEGPDAGIDAEDVRRAAALVAYFAAHARKVHAAMDADRTVAVARRLLRWVRKRKPAHALFSRRDAYRAVQADCATADDVDPVLELLAERAYIRPLTEMTTGRRGRQGSPRFEVHPRISDPDPAP